MQDTINLRQFMQQITALIDKVALDMSNTRHALRQTRQRLADAQEEKLKMQSLVEHDLHRQRTAEKLREQKQMDELAVRQFNINHLAGQA
jgi:flagellar export protein FliJ